MQVGGGAHREREVLVSGVMVQVEPVLRFLGVMITADGRFAPWRDSYDAQLYALQQRLCSVGLGCLPIAYTSGIFVSVMPSLLFGCEIWGVDEIYDVMFKGTNPFHSVHLRPLLNHLKKWLGLPQRASHALVHRLLALPCFARLALPRFMKLTSNISEQQWDRLRYVARLKQGLCYKILRIRDTLLEALQQHPTISAVIEQYEVAYWRSSEEGGRHWQLQQIFGNGLCSWSFLREGVSRQTTQVIARFLCMQHEYFYCRGRRLCACNEAPASLEHILCMCPYTRTICERMGVPSVPAYLRFYLLTQKAYTLYTLFSQLLQHMALGGSTELVTLHQLTPPRHSLHRQMYVAYWDGSFQQEGAGLGVEVFLEDTCVFSISVPVIASDATRCEALGPVLISMLMSRFAGGCLTLRGDSKYVCNLLNCETSSQDVHLYNCSQLVRDMLSKWWIQVEWIRRERNSRCDALARRAVLDKIEHTYVDLSFAPRHERAVLKIVRDFRR